MDSNTNNDPDYCQEKKTVNGGHKKRAKGDKFLRLQLTVWENLYMILKILWIFMLGHYVILFIREHVQGGD